MTAHSFKNMSKNVILMKSTKISPSFMSFCISVKYRNANSDNYDFLSAYCLVPHTVIKSQVSKSSKMGIGPILQMKLWYKML